jgi:hypothetical protein
MPSKEERKRRRAIVRELRGQELADALGRMPISRDQLAALLQHLDAQLFVTLPDDAVHSRCDHTYRFTESFLKPSGLWSPAVQEWLGSYGGYCDCEVTFNVGNYWREHL